MYVCVYIYIHGYNPEEEMGPSLAQICQEDAKTEEQGRCMGYSKIIQTKCKVK